MCWVIETFSPFNDYVRKSLKLYSYEHMDGRLSIGQFKEFPSVGAYSTFLVYFTRKSMDTSIKGQSVPSNSLTNWSQSVYRPAALRIPWRRWPAYTIILNGAVEFSQSFKINSFYNRTVKPQRRVLSFRLVEFFTP